MLPLDNASQDYSEIEQTVLSWVKLYPSFEDISSISALSDGRFFLALLETLPNFKLLNKITEFSGELVVASHVPIIKNVFKSLIKYHQTYLLKDVSKLEINYVELCMGNKEEIFKLLVMIFSALESQESSKKNLKCYVDKLNEDEGEILREMIANCLNFGEETGSSSNRSLKLREEKKMLNTMENMENKIEELELINKELSESLEEEKELREHTNQENDCLKSQIKSILAQNEELKEENHTVLQAIQIIQIESNLIKEKYEIAKTGGEFQAKTYKEEIEKLTKQKVENSLTKCEIQKISEINTEIKHENNKLKHELMQLEKYNKELKNAQNIQNLEFISLKEHCSHLQIQIESFSHYNHNHNHHSHHNYHNEYQPSIATSNDHEYENQYRISENLNWFENQQLSSSSKKYNPRNSSTKFEARFDVRTITDRSFSNSPENESRKENQSVLMNNSSILMNQKAKREKSGKKQNQQAATKSYEELEKHFIDQIRVLTSVIIELQSQLKEVKENQPILMMSNSPLADNRMEKFKSQIKNMFKK